MRGAGTEDDICEATGRAVPAFGRTAGIEAARGLPAATALGNSRGGPAACAPLAAVAAVAVAPCNPSRKYCSALYGLKARAHETLKQYPASLEAQIKALETKEISPTNPYMNNMWEYYHIGLCAEYDVGDFATARKCSQ